MFWARVAIEVSIFFIIVVPETFNCLVPKLSAAFEPTIIRRACQKGNKTRLPTADHCYDNYVKTGLGMDMSGLQSKLFEMAGIPPRQQAAGGGVPCQTLQKEASVSEKGYY